MTTARWRTAAVYVDCPTDGCGGGLESQDGSFLLTRDDLSGRKAGDSVECFECRTEFRLPDGAFRALNA